MDPDADGRAPLTDVLVIGGGFAGLSAATALVEAGARVLVLEARPTLGGRAAAFTDPATGERVDNGQHVLFGCYDETFRFLRRIGTERGVDVQNRLTLDVVDRAGRPSRLCCPRLPPPLHLLGGVIRWDALGWRDRLALPRIRRAMSGGADAPHDTETVRQWLARLNQTPRAIEMLWEPLAIAALNQPIDTAAACSFTQVLARLFGPRPRDAALALPRKPLDELYTLPSRAFIERHGGEVRTSAVAAIELQRGLRAVVRAQHMSARAVVCAVPWHALPDTFPERPAALDSILNDASRTAASPIVTVNLWFDRVVTEHVLVGLPGRAMQWLFDKRTVFGGRASHLSLVSSGADATVGLTNQELVDMARAEVGAALPAARAATLLRSVVVRERRATFSVAPGQPPRPATRTAVPGLFLAGDWIDTGLPATIEGAVISGHRAASMVVGYLARRA